ncbi:hypothetical protein L596_008429 [Steinernema carpocapsae]|uniref:GP-PDE domain-containing protein n=1 Tax=Steinernema carpocapsae TaxID=34508 RepID=A0A4U5PCR0_STECR|nr:hypothetical protein L596_008429 [Steinernema carpocapsae]
MRIRDCCNGLLEGNGNKNTSVYEIPDFRESKSAVNCARRHSTSDSWVFSISSGFSSQLRCRRKNSMQDTIGFFIYGIFKWPNVLLLVPLVFYASYSALRNHPSRSQNKERFFKGFAFGGHRGSPTIEPENTMASMIQAKKEGANLIEFDVSLTKDGVPVILHDDTLDRTTNKSGAIRDTLFEDLKDVNANAKFPRKTGAGAFMAVPTMDELVRWAKENNMKMLFDVKDSDTVLADRLAALFHELDLYDSAIVCSFFPSVIYRVKRTDQKILTGLTWRRWFISYKDLEAKEPRFSGFKHYLTLVADVLHVWGINTWEPSFLGADMILTERREISQGFVNDQRASGREVCAWTVNEVDELRWMHNQLQIPILTDKSFLIKDVILAN